MSELNIYADNNPQQAETYADYATISALLQAQGVRFERWAAAAPLADAAASVVACEVASASAFVAGSSCATSYSR